MAKKKSVKKGTRKKTVTNATIERAVQEGISKALTGKAFEKAVEKALRKVSASGQLQTAARGRFATYPARKKVAKKASGRAIRKIVCGTGPGR